MPAAPTAQLLRQLEAALRKGHGVRDMRWKLRQAGMADDQVWAHELPIRRRIRAERATKPATTAPRRRRS